MRITLAEAIKEDRLDKFIEQEERHGLPPADLAELDEALARLIKPRRSEDQTSRSASRDGSAEK